MSHYTTMETQVSDIDAFVDALCENWQDAKGIKLTREDIEVHNTPQNLYGYMGDKREQKANIIIRRDKVGAMSNDIGFNIENGKCTAYISEYDKTAYSPTWNKSVNRGYSKNVIVKAAAKKGLKIEYVTNQKGQQVVRVHQRY